MRDLSTRCLLNAGIAAGPLALTLGFSQAWLRDSFDLHRHASSQLALGDLGWIQSLNFSVAGLLMLAFALGARRVLRAQSGGFWGPVLLGVFAICHVLVGVFSTDPAFDFPPGPGTPQGLPAYDEASASAVLHSLFAGLGFSALAAACFVLAGHFRRGGWRAASLFTGATIVAVAVYGGLWESRHTEPAVRAVAQFDFRPMWASLPVIWGYLTALAWQLRGRWDSETALRSVRPQEAEVRDRQH